MDDRAPGPTERVRPDGGRSGANDGRRDEGLSLDEVFGLLSDPVRRDVLDRLSTADDDVVTVDDVVDAVVAGTAERRRSRPNRNDVTVTLFHVHLPKLATVGVVEYDERSRTVRYHGDERLERWLDLAREEERGEPANEKNG